MKQLYILIVPLAMYCVLLTLFTLHYNCQETHRSKDINDFRLEGKFDGFNTAKIRYTNQIFSRAMKSKIRTVVSKHNDVNSADVIYLIRQLLDPPSKHMIKPAMNKVVETPQSREVAKLLKFKRNGFFVECGAFDGERSSNTFHLEKYREWEGLLIEMDPYYYTQLLGKSRKAWSINSCLSRSNHTEMVEYNEASGGMGSLITTISLSKGTQSRVEVACFPLEAMLKALNRTHVDYLSLDVEGSELEILTNFPFEEITVEILSVEHTHGGSSRKKEIKALMESKGYRLVKDIKVRNLDVMLIVDDFIFVKKS